MKIITKKQHESLEDLSAQGLLRQIPIQTAEKDIHIADVLSKLSNMEVRHDFFRDIDTRFEATRHDVGIQLVFAGGTCLSKAHGLINRMSEDIDIKVILQDVDLKKNRANRSRLIALHDKIMEGLAELNLPLSAGHGCDNPHIRDGYRYCAINAAYKSVYSQLPSLRPELKLEFIHREPLLPVQQKCFGYLYEALAGLSHSSPITISCISVAETLAEKVLSLLRRCAWKWGGGQTGDLDPALVRHVYDVACVIDQVPDALIDAKSIFPQLVERDCEEFKRQNPVFDSAPFETLKRALKTAKTDSDLRARYGDRLLPLVYEESPKPFDKAFKLFEEVAGELLSV